MFGGGLISLKIPHLNFCSAHFHRAFRISTWFIQRERRTKLTMLTFLIKSSRICSKSDRVELSWTFNTCRSCFTGATRGTPCATTAPAVLPPKPMSGKFLLSYWVVCAQRPVCPVPWMLLICWNCCLNINPWELSLESTWINTFQFGTPFRCVFATGSHQLQQCNRCSCHIALEQLVGCFHAPETSTTSHLSTLWLKWTLGLTMLTVSACQMPSQVSCRLSDVSFGSWLSCSTEWHKTIAESLGRLGLKKRVLELEIFNLSGSGS